MRFIYMDEAGTSAREPVRVFAGVIVHADLHWMAVSARIAEVIQEMVPQRHRNGFIFHAKSVWNDHALREDWEFSDRLRFFKAILAVPGQFGLPIVFGRCASDAADGTDIAPSEAQLYTQLFAFMMFVNSADGYVANNAEPEEVATLVAEDNPSMRADLRWMMQEMRTQGFTVPITGQKLAITRIIDTIHFVDKSNGPILQLADACAFTFRRYLSGQNHGELLLRALMGRKPDARDFRATGGGGVLRWVRGHGR